MQPKRMTFDNVADCLLEAAEHHQNLVLVRQPNGQFFFIRESEEIDPQDQPFGIKSSCQAHVMPLHAGGLAILKPLEGNSAFIREFQRRCDEKCKEHCVTTLQGIDPTLGEILKEILR